MVGDTPTRAFEASRLPSTERDPRQIFVAYPYTLYPATDYRKVYNGLAKAFGVKFVFADEKITTLHILEKIGGYIRTSRFGIYDISGWNPNVSLELGLAYGLRAEAYIAFDPQKTPVNDVPADVRGIDRLQYSSYSELGDKLAALLTQEFPPIREHDAEAYLAQLRQDALGVVRDSDGVKIGDIANALGISVDLAKVVVRPIVDAGAIRIDGIKRGAKYYID